MFLAIIIVLCIVLISKLLQVINDDGNQILKIKKNKNSYEEELLSHASEYINEVMRRLSDGSNLPNYVVIESSVDWDSKYTHQNIVFMETLNHEIVNHKVIVNLHSINRMLVNSSNRTEDIDIVWRFYRDLSNNSWFISSIHISRNYPS